MSSKTQLTLPSPAKINLFLHILGRRPDSYHELQTVFQFIDLCDQLSFTLNDTGQITLESNATSIPLEDNIIIKTTHLLRQYLKSNLGCHITLNKKIPVGGGLGGGSSNAATTIHALNHLWQLYLNQEQMIELGRQLGADVPIFVLGQAAWAEGIGEQLTPITLPETDYLLTNPQVHVDTTKIFSHKELTRDTDPMTIGAFQMGHGHNDCEKLVKKLYPSVASAIDWAAQFGPTRLTGTGGCLFTKFNNQHDALVAQQQMPSNLQGFVVKGSNHSPLLQALDTHYGIDK